jgi:hypothetical protein
MKQAAVRIHEEMRMDEEMAESSGLVAWCNTNSRSAIGDFETHTA